MIKKGQYLAEYAIIISLVLAALVAMKTYVKRGLQGRYKDAADGMLKIATGKDEPLLQYEPYYSESEITTTVGTVGKPNEEKVTVSLGGSRKTKINNITTRQGEQKLLPASEAD